MEIIPHLLVLQHCIRVHHTVSVFLKRYVNHLYVQILLNIHFLCDGKLMQTKGKDVAVPC